MSCLSPLSSTPSSDLALPPRVPADLLLRADTVLAPRLGDLIDFGVDFPDIVWNTLFNPTSSQT